jgi:hypothetical protein
MRRILLLLSASMVCLSGATFSNAADQVVQVNAINNKVIDVTFLSNNRRKVLRISQNIRVKREEVRDRSLYQRPATLRDIYPGVKVTAFGVDYDTVIDIVFER